MSCTDVVNKMLSLDRSFIQLSEDVYMDTVMGLSMTVINIRQSPIYQLHRCGVFLKSTCTIILSFGCKSGVV